MVVRCMECKHYVSFTAYLGDVSRVLNNCICQNEVQIHELNGKEDIQAKDMAKILIWHSVDENWITFERYQKLCG